MTNVLLIDPDRKTRSALHVLLAADSFRVSSAGTSDEAIQLLKSRQYNLVIIDQNIFTDNAFDPISWLGQESPQTGIILLNEYQGIKRENIIAAMGRPFDINAISMNAVVSQINDFSEAESSDLLEAYIQECCDTGQSKAILVASKSKKGVILTNQGKVYYASQDNLRGEAAFYRILSWKQAVFQDVAVNNFPAPNIYKEYRQLMANSANSATGHGGNKETAVGTAEMPNRQQARTASLTPSSPRARKRRRPGVLAAITVLLLAVVAGAAFLLQPNAAVTIAAPHFPAQSTTASASVPVASEQQVIKKEQPPLADLAGQATTVPAASEKMAAAVPPAMAKAAQAAIAETAVDAATRTPVPPLEERVILRLHGSNTVGGELAPALIEAYLQQKSGVKEVVRVPGAKENEQLIKARFDDHLEVVDIQAHGSSTGFKDLIAGECDIAMASRRVKAKETEALADKGDMTAASSEHVIALDGIAVIVHRSNPLKTLTMEQLANIFSGKITNWSELGGSDQPIRVYARDDNSGTFDTFQSIVLDEQHPLVVTAKRFESNPELSASVAQDSAGIGFCSLATIGTVRALSIAESGAEAILPSFFTVATEDYPLARRLYMYSEAKPSNPHVLDFIEFVHSYNGQEVVKAVGQVDMNIKSLYARQPELSRAMHPEKIAPYAQAIDRSQRLSINFRFNSGTSQLDNRALRDLDRVVNYLKDKLDHQIFLVGFADNAGGYEQNIRLAMSRAETVHEQLRSRGITVRELLSCGEELPVATNATDTGRQKNRRVEVWLR